MFWPVTWARQFLSTAMDLIAKSAQKITLQEHIVSYFILDIARIYPPKWLSKMQLSNYKSDYILEDRLHCTSDFPYVLSLSQTGRSLCREQISGHELHISKGDPQKYQKKKKKKRTCEPDGFEST